MPGGWWCCCQGCWSWSDLFNRGNSTDPGDDWDEVDGDWGIYNFALVETYGGGGEPLAKIVNTDEGSNAVPSRSANSFRESVTITDPTIGDKYYLYIALENRDSIEPKVCFEYTNVNEWLVTVMGDGQEASKTMNCVPNEEGEFIVEACIEPYAWFEEDGTNPARVCMLRGSVLTSTNEWPWLDDITVPSGKMYGLGHDNAETGTGTGSGIVGAEFDDFEVHELIARTVVCDTCFCRCDWRMPLKKKLTLTIVAEEYLGTGTGTPNRVACFDGYTCDLDAEWNVSGFIWRGDLTYVYDPMHNHTFYWRLSCGQYDEEKPFDHLSLMMETPQQCCSSMGGGTCPVMTPDDEASTCVPLSLVFGPYTTTKTNLSCWLCYAPLQPMVDVAVGEFYVVITQS